MSQTRRLGTTATTVRRDGDATHVRYHQTDVVSFDDKTITLRTGGWKTATTKLRMNQAANQFKLHYGVHQEKGQWYITRWDEERWDWNNKIPFNPSGVHILERNPS